MRTPYIGLVSALLFSVSIGGAVASDVTFTPRELFRIPFGDARQELGATISGGQFIFPGEFTMDPAGHFYIYDAAKHRIARFSWAGAYEVGFLYPETAGQVFAHADDQDNLWLLVADQSKGIYYGVHDAHGKALRTAVFSQYNHFRLHVGDDFEVRAILSSDRAGGTAQMYRFDTDSLLMKKDMVARPPLDHHAIHKNDRVYYTDRVPDTTPDGQATTRITDGARRHISDIQGTVIYTTDRGEFYTRVSAREIRIYDAEGKLKGKVMLTGLSATCASIRFDPQGNLYQLDGIPDLSEEGARANGGSDPRRDPEDRRYTSKMVGMRMIKWERTP